MTPALELAKRRYSCRRYLDQPLADSHRTTIADFLASLTEGPFGNTCRFALIAAGPEDSEALKGLGTYGFIRGAAGFIVGAVRPAPKDMEDYGYCLERAVLKATDINVGTCWLGGSFTRSSFAAKIAAGDDEVLPAVIALGYPKKNSENHWIRRSAKGSLRKPHEQLFFDQRPESPLDISTTGQFAEALEMVRWAPSASNKQPWRVVRENDTWHFYLERLSDPNKGMVHSVIKIADVQRVDMGIAMYHFELAAREASIDGRWVMDQPAPGTGAGNWEYTASWISD